MGVGRGGGGLPHGRGRGQVKFNPQQNKGGGGDGQSFGHTEGVHKKLPPFKTRGGSAENVLTMSRGGGANVADSRRIGTLYVMYMLGSSLSSTLSEKILIKCSEP